MDRRARAAPGRVGGVVRQPSHGRHSRPIRIISVHLLDAAGRLLLVLFLDHQAARLATSKWPHLSSAALRAPREALILASNQQRVLGPQARVQVL